MNRGEPRSSLFMRSRHVGVQLPLLLRLVFASLLLSAWRAQATLTAVVSSRSMKFSSSALVTAAAETATAQEKRTVGLCLRRVAPLPRGEGYSVLCASVGALFQQQHGAESEIETLRQENERLKAQLVAQAPQRTTRLLLAQKKEEEKEHEALVELRRQLEEARKEPEALLRQIRALSAENARLVSSGCTA
mmetsp:Transcript_75499/g.196399  ORF Transcript_75499/g.196399 Transcript_75499/m.196399 type:complete len:191 (-) Transcript_75499:39-611(-)